MPIPPISAPPELRRAEAEHVIVHAARVDGTLPIVVAFSERAGGVSRTPYDSLNLAAHVGDDPASVDENRTRFLGALGLAHLRSRLTLSRQVHGVRIAEVAPAEVGAGAYAALGRPPLPDADALLTLEPDVPLMLLFADCVPIVLVAPAVPAAAVVHAGWRGLSAGIVRMAVEGLSAAAVGSDLFAYVGAHIQACCYEVGPEVHESFEQRSLLSGSSGKLSAVCGPLDLSAAVVADLVRAGVPVQQQVHLGICTADSVGQFFSYRAESGRTGRHGALVVIDGGTRRP
jgi:hypothetical protein